MHRSVTSSALAATHPPLDERRARLWLRHGRPTWLPSPVRRSARPTGRRATPPGTFDEESFHSGPPVQSVHSCRSASHCHSGGWLSGGIRSTCLTRCHPITSPSARNCRFIGQRRATVSTPARLGPQCNEDPGCPGRLPLSTGTTNTRRYCLRSPPLEAGWRASLIAGKGIDMRSIPTVLIVLALVSAAGCGGEAESDADDSASSSDPTETSPPSAAATSDLVGTWHRAQGCAEMLAAFEEAGLAKSHRGWLQGNFYGGEPGPKSGDPCADARGPLEHDHYFTAEGQFGSHDENGEEVDDGDYAELDADTVTFPSHAQEFGYDGDILGPLHGGRGCGDVRGRPSEPLCGCLCRRVRVGIVRLRLRAMAGGSGLRIGRNPPTVHKHPLLPHAARDAGCGSFHFA